MHRIFLQQNFLESQLSCPHCCWKGPGSEAKEEYLFLTDAIEVYCPHCQHYFGFISQEEDLLS